MAASISSSPTGSAMLFIWKCMLGLIFSLKTLSEMVNFSVIMFYGSRGVSHYDVAAANFLSMEN